ncbi:MAG TPA: hypothetical protein EYH31_05990, partial [Anaerolineae bacterium]|nr:hypothetical protein [Anaerolineae bacterium]
MEGSSARSCGSCLAESVSMFSEILHRRREGEDEPRLRTWGMWARAAFYGGIYVIASLVLLSVRVPFAGRITLEAGDVAQTDIRAPRGLTYVSQILTEQAQQQAAAAVPDQYDPPQARIRRQQVSRAREVLDFIDSVRADPYATPEERAAYLAAITDVQLSPDIIDRILALPPQSWGRVMAEVPQVLDRVMRGEIRETNIATARSLVPNLISQLLNDEETAITTVLVQALTRPNTFYNAQQTEARRRAAREAVPPQSVTIEQGETIVRAGDIVNPLDVEALDALGLRQQTWNWRQMGSTALFALIISTVLGVYLV